MKCKVCSRQIYSQTKLYCCKKLDSVCLACSVSKCKDCKAQLAPKPKPQTKQYAIKPPEKGSKCGLCKYMGTSHSIMFKEQNCNYLFCFECIRNYYLTYLRMINDFKTGDGSRPEIPVQVPCHCVYPEQQIIDFLRQCCYVCFRKIQREGYELTNNTRVMKSCYDTLKVRVNSSLLDQKQFRQLQKLIAKCSSCNRFVDEIGSKIDDIFICKDCHEKMALTQSAYEKKKQDEDKLAHKTTFKKICSKCKALFVTKKKEDDPPPLCKKCELDQDVVARPVDRQVKSGKYQKIEQKPEPQIKQSIKEKNIKVKQLTEQQQIPSKDIDHISLQSITIKASKSHNSMVKPKKNDLKDKAQVIMPKQKSIVKPDEEKKINIAIQKQQEVDRDPLGFYKVDPYKMTFPQKTLQQKTKQCSKCSIYFLEATLLKIFENISNEKNQLRILEEQNIKQEEATMLFCSECYVDLKMEVLMKKKSQRRRKIEAQIQNRYMRSVPKKQKVQTNFKKADLFRNDFDLNNYEKPPTLSALFVVDSPKKGPNPKISDKYKLEKRCKECQKIMDVPVYSINLYCIDCKMKKQAVNPLAVRR